MEVLTRIAEALESIGQRIEAVGDTLGTIFTPISDLPPQFGGSQKAN
jgi:hypothetical protein